MKKLYFSILTVICGLGLNAQTITVSNYEPLNGEQYTTYHCDSTGFTAGASIQGATWTFSPLITHSSTAANFTVMSISGNTMYPSANINIKASNNEQSFITTTTNNISYWGGNLSLGGANVSVTYTTPATTMVYPFSYGTGTVTPTAGSLVVLGNNATFTGVCTTTCNGTGTLVLPSKTFTDVIRVTTTQNLSFTVPAITTGTATQIVWDYYSLSDSKFPMFSFNTSTINSVFGTSTQTFAIVKKDYNGVTGINKNSKEETALYNVFPNPSHSHVNFVTDNNNVKSVFMYDITGKLVETQTISNGKLSLNVGNYPAGLYIYKLIDNTDSPVRTGKITISR